MKLIAGKGGLNNLVKWVHIIEDDSATGFLHGNELVFTAGILNQNDSWLLNFAQKLYEAGASALVVNIGPHTSLIHKNVIEYCNAVNLPLFTIPWETKMVDMTRDFCHRIIKNEHNESTVATTLKNIIFNVGDIEGQILQLERYGYRKDSSFCFICLSSGAKNKALSDEYESSLAIMAEKAAKSIHEQFITFTYNNNLIFVLPDYTEQEIDSFIKDFVRAAGQDKKPDFHIGIGPCQAGIYNQKSNFEKAVSAMEMAMKTGESYCCYSKLGLYKLLYAVGDKTVLRSYYNDYIEKLEAYDRENDTQLTALLRSYLDNNGSLQAVSEELYVHRNTVTNQLKKIERITGCNPQSTEDIVKLFIAFSIKDIL